MISLLFPIPLYAKLIASFCISYLLFLLFASGFLAWLKRRRMIDHFRLYSPNAHRSKIGTPSGGGLLILLALLPGFLLLVTPFSFATYLLLAATFYFAFVGFLDDSLKGLQQSSRGLSSRFKFALQLPIAFAIALFLYHTADTASLTATIPLTIASISPGPWYFAVVVIVIVGAANAVNLSDGLDGLAAGCMVPPAIVFILIGVMAAIAGTSSNGPFLLGATAELAVFWAALLGALLAFLKYNRYPARMFMGEVGSQALGGALGVTAVLLRIELILIILGGVYVAETLSVMLQVSSYKLTGKRVFRMTPLHHHFELTGHTEPNIVRGFWTTSILLALASVVIIIAAQL